MFCDVYSSATKKSNIDVSKLPGMEALCNSGYSLSSISSACITIMF